MSRYPQASSVAKDAGKQSKHPPPRPDSIAPTASVGAGSDYDQIQFQRSTDTFSSGGIPLGHAFPVDERDVFTSPFEGAQRSTAHGHFHNEEVATSQGQGAFSRSDSDAIRPPAPKKGVRFATYSDDDESKASDIPEDIASESDPRDAHTDATGAGPSNIAAEFEQKLQQFFLRALKTLTQPTFANRLDQDVRARFWKKYKAEAEEFHTDFLRKYTDEMDNSLIFSGLFSAVSATFIAMMQPNLQADPDLATQALLMMVVHSLNSSAFAGQTLELPSFNGPSTMTIWIQSLIYASLGASLFAALGAMMGKQWLSHYARVGNRGTVEQRCINRQRKLAALHTWHFHVILQCIPLLLQLSLLLFGVGIAAYMWGQQRVVAWVIISIVVISCLLYSLSVLFTLIYPDCPFHSPITDLLSHISPYISYPIVFLKKHLEQLLSKLLQRRTVPSSPADLLESMYSLPMTMGDTESSTSSPSWRAPLVKVLRMLSAQSQEVQSVRTKWSASEHKGLDAYCVNWLLLTSTDPDDLITAARMVLEVDWPVEINLGPMTGQLWDSFIRCFSVQQDNTYHLLPHAGDRATACGQALLHARIQRRQKELIPEAGASNVSLTLNNTAGPNLAMEANPTGSWWPNDKNWLTYIRVSDPDLRVICWALDAFSESPTPTGYNHSSYVFSVNPPTSSFMEWFSHHALYCLYDPTVFSDSKLRLGVVLAHFLSLSPPPNMKILANCLMGSAMLLGSDMQSELLSPPDRSASFEHFLHSTLVGITNLTEREFPRLKLRQPEDNLQQLNFARVLLRPLMDLLIRLDAAEEYRSALHHAEFHHWVLRLCRQLVSSAGSHRESEWSAFQPSRHYIRHCIRMSILTACPPTQDNSHDIMSNVWRIRYQRTESNPEPLTSKDYPWILSLVRHTMANPDGETDVDLVTNCLVLLGEISKIGFKYDHSAKFFGTLSWAMQPHSSNRIRHAGLRLARSMCGHQPDVNDLLLRSLVHHMGGIEQFCVALTVTSPLLDAGHLSRHATSYHWVLAYLDLVCGLSARDEWVPHIFNHARQCASFAGYLISDNGRNNWFMELTDAHARRLYLGWDTDIRPGRLQNQDLPDTVTDLEVSYQNTYVRDIWFRLVQIVVRCDRVRRASSADHASTSSYSVDSGLHGEAEARARLAIACAAWQIHDTHPLSEEFLLKVADFSKDAISNAPDALVAVHKPIIQDARRGLSHWDVEYDDQAEEGTPLGVELKSLKRLFERKLDGEPSQNLEEHEESESTSASHEYSEVDALQIFPWPDSAILLF